MRNPVLRCLWQACALHDSGGRGAVVTDPLISKTVFLAPIGGLVGVFPPYSGVHVRVHNAVKPALAYFGNRQLSGPRPTRRPAPASLGNAQLGVYSYTQSLQKPSWTLQSILSRRHHFRECFCAACHCRQPQYQSPPVSPRIGITGIVEKGCFNADIGFRLRV